MAQKANPNILRLGNISDWKSKYIEKSSLELSNYNFKNIEIKKYLQTFLKKNGLLLKNYKIFMINSALHIYISYITTSRTIFKIKNLNRNLKLKNISNKKKNYYFNKNFVGFRKNIKNFKLFRKLNQFVFKQILLKKKIVTLNKKESLYLKKKVRKKVKRIFLERLRYLKNRKQTLKRLINIKHYKRYKNRTKVLNYNKLKNQNFLEIFTKTLLKFFGNCNDLYLILKDINKTNAIKYRKKKKDLNPIKQRIAQLRRFKNLIFYKDGINIISNIILHKQPSNVLAEFIASILKRLKQPNSFFIFLKRTLDLFINQPLSKIGGIKILISGRVKKSPRSKTAKIFSGSIPLQTINSNIEHYQATAYTKKGTLGVKVWVRSKF